MHVFSLKSYIRIFQNCQNLKRGGHNKKGFRGKKWQKNKRPPPAIKHSRVNTIHIYIIILNTKKKQYGTKILSVNLGGT